MKNPDFFKSKLEPLIFTYLKDRASAIRVSAIERIQELTNAYGNNWIVSFFDKLSDILTKSPSFHFKIAAIYTLREVIFSTSG